MKKTVAALACTVALGWSGSALADTDFFDDTFGTVNNYLTSNHGVTYNYDGFVKSIFA